MVGGSQRNVGISRMVAFGFLPYVNQSPFSPSCLYRYRKTMNIRLKGGGEWGGAGGRGYSEGLGLTLLCSASPSYSNNFIIFGFSYLQGSELFVRRNKSNFNSGKFKVYS